MTRRSSRLVFLAAASAVSLAAPSSLRAQARPGAAERSRTGDEISSRLRLAVARGLEFVVSRQRRSGDFDDTVPVAVNALVGTAFLAGGTTEEVGPEHHVRALRRCTLALLERQTAGGYFSDGHSRMYGHGFATLYLAELYGTTSRNGERLRSALERAIRVIETSQSRDGGWDYTPRSPGADPAATISDTSITVCQTMALRASQNLGLTIDAGVIGRARRYIEKAQNPDGGFRYRQQLDRYIRQDSAFARSAAGVCILYSLGEYRSRAIRQGFEYLSENYRSPWIRFPFYGHYYCTQAMFQAGGRYWEEYFPWVREHLLAIQESDGGWRASSQENAMQCTAMALIILQLPYRFLPIHER